MPVSTIHAWAATRPDRTHRNRCGMCDAAENTSCREPDFNHTGRVWEIAMTSRGGREARNNVLQLDGPCRATIEDIYVWDWTRPGSHGDHAHNTGLLYRGACLGCGWAGPSTDDENTAVEDAHDHALPLWRTAPVVTRPDREPNAKTIEKWSIDIGLLYERYGLSDAYSPANGGVIRTMRQLCGTRSHLTRGFYDVCAGLAHVTAATPSARAEPAPTLF